MEVVSVGSILQEPSQTILLHRDMFYQITKKYPDDKRLKVRANIYSTRLGVRTYYSIQRYKQRVARIVRIGNKEKVFCGIVTYFIQVLTLDFEKINTLYKLVDFLINGYI